MKPFPQMGLVSASELRPPIIDLRHKEEMELDLSMKRNKVCRSQGTRAAPGFPCDMPLAAAVPPRPGIVGDKWRGNFHFN